jgi:hypothetical protein
MRASTIAAIVLALVIVVVPVIGGVSYIFGGQYYHAAYPLKQANNWIQSADGLAGQPPAYQHPQSLALLIEKQTSLGWAFINQSDRATGVGNGSPCWFFAQPSQTYGYVNLMLSQTFTYLVNLSSPEPTYFFNATTWQSTFGVVGQLLGAVSNSLTGGPGSGTIEGCIVSGEVSWFGWVFGDIAIGIGGLAVAWVKAGRE